MIRNHSEHRCSKLCGRPQLFPFGGNRKIQETGTGSDLRYIGYLEQIHAPAEYLEQVKFLQKIVADLTIKAKDLKPFRFRL